MEKADCADVGVIIGRFQVPYLHGGHQELIDYVVKRHKKVVIVLGISQTQNTVNNPLDWESRKNMVQESYPKVIILGCKDSPSDQIWSGKIDQLLEEVVSPTQSVMLYGSRDSFIDHYHGKHPTVELVQESYMSGTDIRNEARKETRSSEDFRAGVIWASANRFPTVFTCVDVMIFRPDYEKVLLGKKKHDTKHRLVGGYADVNSPSFEDDAYREVYEETRCGLITLDYQGSFLIDDWRYRKEPDTIKSILFRATTEDVGKANDDLDEVFWIPTEAIAANVNKYIEEMHQPLVNLVLKGLNY